MKGTYRKFKVLGLTFAVIGAILSLLYVGYQYPMELMQTLMVLLTMMVVGLIVFVIYEIVDDFIS